MEAQSDIVLVTQVAVFHNKRAFDQLVRKYQSPVRRLLLNLTMGNEALSDDLAQDTFIKAYTHIAQFRAMSSLQTWLFRIAYHTFYDYQRSHVHTLQTEPTDGAAMQLPSPNTTSEVPMRMDLYSALAQLTDAERACVTLQYIDGESIAHIAKIIGIGENTVKSHLKRGKEKMAQFLRKNGYE